MGATSSSFSDLGNNEYLRKFVGKESVSPNDPFWNRFLSFSFALPLSSSDYRLLDESGEKLAKHLVVNNLETGNFHSLLLVFLRRSEELKASAQTEDSIFTWQTYNALFILRCVVKHFIETMKEEDLVKQFQFHGQGQEADDHGNMVEVFLNALVEIVVDVPLKKFTYLLQLEAINTLLVMLSVQMFSPKPANKSTIYRNLMQGKCSIHACLLMKTLLQQYANQEKAPPTLLQSTDRGLVFGLASSLWSIVTLKMGQGPAEEEERACETPLARQALLLILVLANHCTNEKGHYNPYRQALFSFSNSQTSFEVTLVKATATFKLDYDKLYCAICQTLNSDPTTLLLYLLVHQNTNVKTYILSRPDIENLIIPILKVLYCAPERSSHHIYMSLIVLLILSEDDNFNKLLHKRMLKNVSWYTERTVSEISLGGLLILVVIRTIQYNMLKIRDKYLHTNCLAALANMSSNFQGLHPYVSQRLVSLFELLARKHSRLLEQVNPSGGELEDCAEEDVADETIQDLTVLEEVLRMVLEIINSVLSSQLAENPNLAYTLLYKREVFDGFRNHPAFQDVIQNIDLVIDFFSERLERCTSELGVREVMAVIERGAGEWSQDRLVKFPDLKFKYVEEDQPEEFFIPYIWSLVYQLSTMYWNSSSIKLFNIDPQGS